MRSYTLNSGIFASLSVTASSAAVANFITATVPTASYALSPQGPKGPTGISGGKLLLLTSAAIACSGPGVTTTTTTTTTSSPTTTTTSTTSTTTTSTSTTTTTTAAGVCKTTVCNTIDDCGPNCRSCVPDSFGIKRCSGFEYF